MSDSSEYATFWEHLDELRARLIRVLVVLALMTIGAFLLKEPLFRLVLAPKDGHFVTNRLLGFPSFTIHLVNTGLTEQFMVHMRTALYAGLLLTLPYIIYEMFRFVSPGLYQRERYYALWIVSAAYVMFMVGVIINFLLIFPLTVRFLGTYQVSPEVANMLTLQSYIDTLIGMSFMMGVLFELPVVSFLLGRMGLINDRLMSVYRRHAIVAILILAAIVTPTTDVFTLFVVAAPICVLYEASILLLKTSNL